jgi:hypothetical protein
MPEDLSRLEAMVKSGASAMRTAAAFRRTIGSVKIQAKKLGCRFPNEKDLRRNRQAVGISPPEF